jgi:hypothetical protein
MIPRGRIGLNHPLFFNKPLFDTIDWDRLFKYHKGRLEKSQPNNKHQKNGGTFLKDLNFGPTSSIAFKYL